MIFCPVRSRMSPRLAGVTSSRSALASESPRYFSACTPCTNQNEPARKTKMTTIAHSRALMRNVRNFWSSRYTRIGSPESLAEVCVGGRSLLFRLLSGNGDLSLPDHLEQLGIRQV